MLRLPQWLIVFWPYVLAGAIVLFWQLLLRQRIEHRGQFLVVAFVTCAVSNMAIEFFCAYLVPLDIAGTAPPDVRNAWLRFVITAAVQVPVALVLAYWIAARTKVDRWEEP
jgi:hypothetical protein